ncbi:MAG: LysM peptidoglycan-binding domain-containing protein [Ignavibacteriales bacterium]|nr:LysM peptidoglycan-binding domain-containing protein [Ignavibacteriales bacterium]
MSIQEKYLPVLDLAKELGAKVTKTAVEGTALKVEATVKTQYEKNLIWTKIKEIGGASPQDIHVDIKTEVTDYFHVHKVVAGDTLSGIAKKYFGDAGKYPELAKFNNISNPDLIKVGQEIKIPNK